MIECRPSNGIPAWVCMDPAWPEPSGRLQGPKTIPAAPPEVAGAAIAVAAAPAEGFIELIGISFIRIHKHSNEFIGIHLKP